MRSWTTLTLATLLLAIAPAVALPCPFCSAVSMTFGEEMKASDAAVIVRLVDKPASPEADAGGQPATPAKCVFEVVKVLKGEALLAGKKKIEVLYFGQQEPGTLFLLFGVDPKEVAWSTPTALTDRGVEYLDKTASLPEAPAERLAFFQEYLEDEDPLLSGDAYNEFAKAPYSDVKLLKDRMHRDKLLAWIRDDKVPASRRRLYLTMIGVCGQPEDVPMLEEMIKTDDRQVRTALDAMIGCYLTLQGADGLPLVEDLFLKNAKAEYTDTYSAIVALRFLGQETTVVPKERLLAALRHMLDRPQLADLVIPDLARWQDWSAMPRLVQLFKDANEESAWVRVPVIHYLRQCPDPQAKAYIDELAQIDPDAVKRASNFFPLPSGAAVAATAPAAQATAPATTPAAETSSIGFKSGPSTTPPSTPAPSTTPGGQDSSATATVPSPTVPSPTVPPAGEPSAGDRPQPAVPAAASEPAASAGGDPAASSVPAAVAASAPDAGNKTPSSAGQGGTSAAPSASANWPLFVVLTVGFLALLLVLVFRGRRNAGPQGLSR